MRRVIPHAKLYACQNRSFIAVNTALGISKKEDLVNLPDNIGVKNLDVPVATVTDYLETLLTIDSKTIYKKTERPKLGQLRIREKAIIYLPGYLLFAENDNYHGYFNSEDDDVIAIWHVRDKTEEKKSRRGKKNG